MYKKTSIIIVLFILAPILLSSISLTSEASTENSKIGNSFRTIFAAEPVITISHEPENIIINPNDETTEITIKIFYNLTGRYVRYQESRLRHRVIPIELSMEEPPEWCNVEILNEDLKIIIGDDQPLNTTLKITVTEKAPAFEQYEIKLKASTCEIWGLFFLRVFNGEAEHDIPIMADYWPLVTANAKNGNYVEIEQKQTADFEIELENLGNGPTYVECEILNSPSGWSTNIESRVSLASAATGSGNTKQTVHLVIKPPSNYGYSNKIGSFRVKFTPSYVGRPGLLGQPETITFTVKSMGNDSPFGGLFNIDTTTILIILLIILIILVGLVYLKIKK